MFPLIYLKNSIYLIFIVLDVQSCFKTETTVRHCAQKKFDITHLHRVTHVIIAVTDLGEKVLTQLKKTQRTDCLCCGQSYIFEIIMKEKKIFPLSVGMFAFFWILCLIIGQNCILCYQRYNSLLVLLLSSHHGVAFPRSCLAVCKYAHIVAFKGMKQHLLSDVLVHLHLGCIVAVLRLQTERKCSGYKGKNVRASKYDAIDIP